MGSVKKQFQGGPVRFLFALLRGWRIWQFLQPRDLRRGILLFRVSVVHVSFHQSSQAVIKGVASRLIAA